MFLGASSVNFNSSKLLLLYNCNLRFLLQLEPVINPSTVVLALQRISELYVSLPQLLEALRIPSFEIPAGASHDVHPTPTQTPRLLLRAAGVD